MTSYTECSCCKCQKWCRLYDGYIKGEKCWYYACDDCVFQRWTLKDEIKRTNG